MPKSAIKTKQEDLKLKAKACLAKKVDIPMSPLWHMGKAAQFNSEYNYKVMQEAVYYLACKAKTKMIFNEDEKEFLKELYEAFWWGGHYKGYKEAAALENHYVNGNGNLLNINPEVYRTSKIVKAAMSAMKLFIAERKKNKKYFASIRCDHFEFLRSQYVSTLRRMNYLTEGKIKSNGVLEAAQKNHRLHKADGHFYLDSYNTATTMGSIKTVWSIKSIYDFEPFEKKDYYTEIPLGDYKLILPDGLSEYMTHIGVAKVFTYYSEWHEVWKP